MNIEQISVSPCSNPEMNLDEALGVYSGLGYRSFEIFTSWTKSAFDYKKDPQIYLDAGSRYGMEFASLHLPEISIEGRDSSIQEAMAAARFAEAVGAGVVLYKAENRSTYVSEAAAFLDAIDELDVIPVIQNHFGTPLSSLEDIKEVYEGIGDKRMRTLLEVGHFHSAGIGWREAAEYLQDSIALVHIKDQIGPQSVPFGKGEIDLTRLFGFLDAAGYKGQYVVEMEVEDRENTVTYLADAYEYMTEYCKGLKI